MVTQLKANASAVPMAGRLKAHQVTVAGSDRAVSFYVPGEYCDAVAIEQELNNIFATRRRPLSLELDEDEHDG